MKKLLVLLMVLIVSLAVFTACKPKTQPTDGSIKTDKDLAQKVLGVPEVPSESSEEGVLDYVNKTSGIGFKKVIIFPSMNELQMALQSKKVDAIVTTDFTTNYYNMTLSLEGSDNAKPFKFFTDGSEFGLKMITREKDKDLVSELNTAIATLKENGKLDELVDKYITNSTSKPEHNEIPIIEGAPTIKLGVSGDLPPLDYTTADGNPAGFNIAMMTEISKLINKNIEVVVIQNVTKFASLRSNRIDVFFWHMYDIVDEIAQTDTFLPVKFGFAVLAE